MVNKQSFIDTYGTLAQDIGEKTGLDPTLVLGQLAHETGWGEHISGNNVFGISPGGKVAAYQSVPEAAQAYVDLINRRYSGAASKQGIYGQAQAISSAGYGPNKGYGGLIANVADSVRAAGYKPNNQPSDDADVQSGMAIFQKMTGIAPQPISQPKEAPADNIDVSSDPDVDHGKEIFKRLTGMDPENSAIDQPRGKAEAAQPDTGAATAQATLADKSSSPQNFAAGVGQGMRDVGDVASGAINSLSKVPGVAWLDKQIPALGALDQHYGTPNTAASQQYDQNYGNSLMANTGRFVGQVIPTLPVGGAIGTAGKAIGAGMNPLMQGAVRLGTGAAQGAAGSAMTGGDIRSGAIGGAALGTLGQSANVISGSLQQGGLVSRALQSKVADSVVGLIGKAGGYHFGDVTGLLLGQPIAEIIKTITEKYGPVVARKAASAINAANSSGVTTGAAGAAAGQVGNQLQGP